MVKPTRDPRPYRQIRAISAAMLPLLAAMEMMPPARSMAATAMPAPPVACPVMWSSSEKKDGNATRAAMAMDRRPEMIFQILMAGPSLYCSDAAERHCVFSVYHRFSGNGRRFFVTLLDGLPLRPGAERGIMGQIREKERARHVPAYDPRRRP